MVCYSWPGQGRVLRRQARPEAAEAHAANRTGQTEATLAHITDGGITIASSRIELRYMHPHHEY